MLRTFAAFLWFCFALPASAKLGETVPQLAKRFGKSYTVEDTQLGKTYKFRSANISVDVIVANGRSISETYLSDHPLTPSGEPPNDIVRAILRTNVPNARWGEIGASEFGADYALRSSDDKYVAILNYTEVQRENSLWIMTVGLAKSLRALSSLTSPSPSPLAPTGTAMPTSTPLPTPSIPPSIALSPQIDFSPSTLPHAQDLRARAETGDSNSEYQLGLCYYSGQGVAKDLSEAVKWFRKAAEQGFAQAQGYLARCYLRGEGVTQDLAEAAKWSRKAADQGDSRGENVLGLCYAVGQAVARDEVEAAKWYRKAAEQNYALAQYNLGNCYAKGQGVTKDEVEAVKWYRKAAEQNYAQAQINLALCYHNGKGVAKDDVEAVKWVRKAAEQNDANAQTMLSQCYAEGQGVGKDDVEAVKWVRKAAEQSFARAQYVLGFFYASGKGVPKNYVEAVKWYRKAAEQNLAVAQSGLGHMYLGGRGVPKNIAEGVRWSRKAAEQGESTGQYNLGLAYYRGDGVVKDATEAAKWLRRAAEQNNAEAQVDLGLCYAGGEGLPKDEVQAYKWWLLAAAKGNQRAKKNITIAEGRMSRYEIAQGQQLARDFRPHQTAASSVDSSSGEPLEARPKAAGTGFFITEDGYLITNEHVATSGTQLQLATAAGLIPAKVVKADAGNDLALLKAEGKFEALPVVASRGGKLGSTVVTVGFPNIILQGFAPKFARGEIASLTGPKDDPRFFQISVPLQPGNSGGALVDERGNVIGVVSAKLSAAAALKVTGELPENVNYAVKSSFLLGFLESIPEVAAKLKEPNTSDMQSADVVEKAKEAAVLVLVY